MVKDANTVYRSCIEKCRWFDLIYCIIHHNPADLNESRCSAVAEHLVWNTQAQVYNLFGLGLGLGVRDRVRVSN